MFTVSKSLVRTLYDVQHERIQTGNRICAEIKNRLGQKPGMSEEQLETEAKDYLDRARAEYRRIADAFVLNQVHKYLKVEFGDYEIITDAGMLVFVELYEEQLAHEEKMAKVIAKIVAQHPLWGAFLDGVKGCGPMMSAVILSEFDIRKAERISQFWKYAGLDVVDWVSTTRARYDETPAEARRTVTMEKENGEGWTDYMVRDGRGRGRYTDHLVDQIYTAKDGKEETKKSITFNPFLKTKLVGVLATCFLKQSPDTCRYRKVYDDYKYRLENHVKYGIPNDEVRIAEAKKAGYKYAPKGHRHNMAMRYMIKMFLQDLWLAWRKLEGLPITAPYNEAILGHEHHQSSEETHTT
jgi:hypothetical protein